LQVFKTASAFYLGLATGRVEWGFLVSNLSAGTKLLTNYRFSRTGLVLSDISSQQHGPRKPASMFSLNATDNFHKSKITVF
jgi:hypothetical protein